MAKSMEERLKAAAARLAEANLAFERNYRKLCASFGRMEKARKARERATRLVLKLTKEKAQEGQFPAHVEEFLDRVMPSIDPIDERVDRFCEDLNRQEERSDT